MNDFERDNEWQRGMRDRILAPGFYGRFAFEGRYVVIDKGRLATTFQKRFAVDTIAQGRDGAAVCIEEKIVRWPIKKGTPHTAFCLETESCTVPGRETDGWMVYGMADYLLYCFETKAGGLDCYLIDFPELQKWFWTEADSFPRFGPLKTLNGSSGRVVPIDAVWTAVPMWRRLLEPQEVAA